MRRATALLLLAMLATTASAETGLEFAVDAVEGDGWRASDIRVSLALNDDDQISAEVLVTELVLPEPVGSVHGISAHCAILSIDASNVRCSGFRLTPGDLPAGVPALSGVVRYSRDSERLHWDLTASPDAGGQLSLRGSQLGSDWSVAVESADFPLAAIAELASLASLAGPEVLSDVPSSPDANPEPAMEAFGSLNLSLEASGSGDGLALSYRGRAEGVGGSNASGTSAVDSVVVEFDGIASSTDTGIEFETRLNASTGEVYQEPIYFRLDDHPLSIAVRGLWSGQGLAIQELRIDQQGVLSGAGEVLLTQTQTDAEHAETQDPTQATDDAGSPPPWTVSSARLSFPRITLPGAYDVLLKPFLATTDLGDLETSGHLSADVTIIDNAPVTIDLNIADVNMDDRAGRLGIYGLSAEFGWEKGRKETADNPVLIAWQGGFVYGIPFGATRLEFAVEPGQWRLRQPGLIPFLNGSVAIDALEIGDFTPGNARVAIDAQLQPVSMRALSRALDWPPLSGSLSGVIPSMSYVDGALTFGGNLRAQMFDGEITVRNFRLREPFNPGSRLEADIDIEDLDLRLVTEALSFGLITGKLDGYVHGLKVYNWSPVAFDARLFTPPNDRSKHRISQRAVDNIANLGGGGGAAALSKGFLKFFEQFSYSGISLGCKMRNDTCEMSGLETVGNSYVILKGKGLPQINVVGYARRASWSTIVEQLKGIIESEGPVVE